LFFDQLLCTFRLFRMSCPSDGWWFNLDISANTLNLKQCKFYKE
jgi:hypothetical protein